MTASVLDAALSAAEPVLLTQYQALRDQFVRSFGHLSRNVPALGDAFLSACQAKAAIWRAKTPEEAASAARTYELVLDAIETLGLDAKIQGEAEAGPILRQVAHLAITCLAAGAGSALTIGIEAALPGAGLVVGPMAGAGVSWIIGELNKAF